MLNMWNISEKDIDIIITVDEIMQFCDGLTNFQ